ncbi:HAD family hydrolase [Radiobacillus sp. PE A8.2]|uniref:HAD family hydrolase n=1 Tax=Radiobacillus sp. PE A8.2 TaxID=3380349 RepID=UPI00388CEF75
MEKYKIILFDLDGTLTDPKEGITKSVQFALKRIGIDEPVLDNLDRFIGPPLQDSFADFYDLDNTQTNEAIAFYRERFVENGMFENKLYTGISLLLEQLKQQYTLVVATSKPTVFAEQILSFFQIDNYFEIVVGSNLDGTRNSKAEIIQYIPDIYKDFKQDEFVMIGDRKHDIIGAVKNGIDSVGVTYGYGSAEELIDAGATYVFGDVDQLNGFFS